MKAVKEIKTKTANISKFENGVIRVAIQDKVHLDANSLEENYKAYVELLDGDDAPFMIIVNDTATIATEGREAYNKKTRNEVRRKDALVIPNPATMLLINSQVTFCKPLIPTQAFLDEASAMRWLVE